ncbi:small acid-soluble spore protein [Clostridium pasteurianum DSM 525 = ATCC 6013]|uniref:Small acid-soluble spore protein n=1 Tax=Clostridium pasteurianum DSM 525 = ATCC 6013 TaxID=1262449 RepID=A0A0H3IYG8_CLOPA|nr:H-type small acid-soluble spore protein [Clostridium pasteurianum]AJA46556.1 small acid-soluble spore protein [Clostridium pasteurianum DSM 525 = ATCC 6013]AJA50544.1 small acid-soluble spore protein [Clostridium pasteurianum DSM 525 = ATCC 6013]AOZ73980.1 spore protein [Clostridium pasteurianum DSM 525 = ATCC 6013]AOZ77777.1 spore protein [Clostridium pasteurianum]ELP61128.1 small acid-soluble spore protein [Clostridium pasteurianum DSM 525 = ATCC 6013]
MDIKKANEIVESLGVIDVNYKGNPVWIESINEGTNEIQIKDLNTDKHFTVNAAELSEN